VMPKEGQPGRVITTGFRPVVLGNNTPNHVSISLDAERSRDD
jgi:hypothetical protein